MPKRKNLNGFALPLPAGQSLIEVMVAVCMAAFLAITMGISLSQTIAASVGAENQLKAQDIAFELLDRIRRTPYSNLSTLAQSGDTFQMPVYSDDGVSTVSESYSDWFGLGPQVNGTSSNSALMDLSSYNWSPGATANRLQGSSPNHFGTANIALAQAPGPLNNAVTATVTVTWTETTATRSVTVTSTISSNGIHD